MSFDDLTQEQRILSSRDFLPLHSEENQRIQTMIFFSYVRINIDSRQINSVDFSFSLSELFVV